MLDLMSAARGAVFRALKAGVAAEIAPVYDDVPQDTPPPFVKIGFIDSESTASKAGQAERLTIEVYAVCRGSRRSVLLAMMHAARVALDRQPIAADGVDFQPPRFVKAASGDASEGDGATYVGSLFFTIDAEPALPEEE